MAPPPPLPPWSISPRAEATVTVPQTATLFVSDSDDTVRLIA